MEDKIKELELRVEVLTDENVELKKKLEELRRGNNSFLYSALYRAQAEFPLVKKGCKSFGNQKYATYADCVAASRKILTKNGLSISQYRDNINDKDLFITRLCHSSGQQIESKSPVILVGEKVVKTGDLQKEIGCAQSYTFRRDYNSIIGLVADEE